MSFPIVHSLVGYSIYRTGRIKNAGWGLACSLVFLSNAADLDFLPGILVGNSGLFHRTFGHSLGAALFCGLGMGLIYGLWKKHGFFRIFLLSSAVYISHLVLDLLGPSPEMAFLWPLHPAHLSERLLIFRSLPLNCDGIKDFACGIFSNVACVQRFWKEIFCLFLSLLFYFFRPVFRRRSLIRSETKNASDLDHESTEVRPAVIS